MSSDPPLHPLEDAERAKTAVLLRHETPRRRQPAGARTDAPRRDQVRRNSALVPDAAGVQIPPGGVGVEPAARNGGTRLLFVVRWASV